MKAYTKPFVAIFLILLADQALKFWIKLNMSLGQEYKIFGNWAIIHFTENNGMAFGIEFGGEAGKLALSLFRIVAVCGIGYGLVHLIKKKYHRGLIMNLALIFAGALGNIIDSTFYGIIFNESSYYEPSVLFPPKEVIQACSMVKWSICFMFRSCRASIRNGSLLGW
jgi:signal peptidase II